MTQTAATPSSASAPAPCSAVPPRARLLFEFCARIVYCAIEGLMVWIGEDYAARDRDLKRFRLLNRYAQLALKVLWTLHDKPERLTLAQFGWLRRSTKLIQYLFGRPLDFSPLDNLTQPAKPAMPTAPGDPNRPNVKHPATHRPVSSDHCPPVPDELDAKYVKAPGRVLATICTNLVRLMSGALPVEPVRERMQQELDLARKGTAPQEGSKLVRASFSRAFFKFIRPASPAPAPSGDRHPPP